MSDLLQVTDLSIDFSSPRGLVKVLHGIGLRMGREKLGIVGESGSGKSLTARAIAGVLPAAARARGRIILGDTDLTALRPTARRALAGRRIGMILQDPRYSLNPVMRCGVQIAEAYRLHAQVSATEARRRALVMLEAVQIRDPERVYGLYPHEVSGGMGQRVMIAMMLIPEPDLLIADEPTSALDVTVQNQVLTILDGLVTARGMGLIFISHDLDLVAAFCDRVLVMYAGRIVESLRADQLHSARHPYTQGLLAARPRLGAPPGDLPVLVRDPAWAGTGFGG